MPDTNTMTMAGVWALVIGLIGLVLRNIGPWRKQISDMEEKLRAELHADIEVMRATIKSEREAHLAQSQAEELLRTDLVSRLHRLETSASRQQLRHNAERALDRHRLNNITACFDALLMMLRVNPEKATEAIKLVEEMRSKQFAAETEEKAIIRAAEIQMDGNESDHDGN